MDMDHMANNHGSKTSSRSTLCIADLPDVVFTKVATFLPKSSRAIFAVAMNWSLQPSAISRAIISSSSASQNNPGKRKRSGGQYESERLDHEEWQGLDF
mmetsp:Transcript_28807/g.61425  ORF Transcript_28807/g.61425 Transcript_28807/m.61425 type:complete len:99 (-) Transcript_28807:17-313(-)